MRPSEVDRSDCRILSEKLSDLIESDRNSSQVLGILGIGFRQEIIGCRNSIQRIPTTSDEFLSDPTGQFRPGMNIIIKRNVSLDKLF